LNKRRQRTIEKEGAWRLRDESIINGSQGGPAGEWRQSRLHHWLEQAGTENYRERGSLEVERGEHHTW
jgi:hypothetical protein